MCEMDGSGMGAGYGSGYGGTAKVVSTAIGYSDGRSYPYNQVVYSPPSPYITDRVYIDTPISPYERQMKQLEMLYDELKLKNLDNKQKINELNEIIKMQRQEIKRLKWELGKHEHS